MSRELVENCHYINARGKFIACDIIDNGKAISILYQDKDGSLTNAMIPPQEHKEFRKKLKELLTQLTKII